MLISEGSLPIDLPGGNPAAKTGPAEYVPPAPDAVRRKRYHQKGKPPKLGKLPAFKQGKKAFEP